MNRPVVLLTGAAGFIGRYVARKFASHGWIVHGVGRGSFSDAAHWGVANWMPAEVSTASLKCCTRDAQIVIHCAGGASVGKSVEMPAEDFTQTVQSMSAVLEFIRTESPQSRLIYPSSAAVYGQVDQLPIQEHELTRPISPYGVHKRMSEMLCELYSKQYGVHSTILRLFSIYGPELRKQLLWDACEKLTHGDATFFGTGREIRDWLYVGDLAELIYQSSTHATEPCVVLNAASGQGVSVAEILEHLRDCLELALPLRFSAAHKIGDPNAMVADIAKARAQGWRPTMSWKDGIADYVKWYTK